MRKLISIKDIAGKTVESADNFDGQMVIHFTDGSSFLTFAYDGEDCGDSYPLIGVTVMSDIQTVTEPQLESMLSNNVITGEEYDAEYERREALEAAAAREAERAQYEQLKAKFESERTAT